MPEPLAQLLAEKGFIKFGDIDGLVAEAKRQGLRLGQYLIAEGLISKNQLGQVLESNTEGHILIQSPS